MVVEAQDMLGWWCRICGGGSAGYVVDKLRIILNSAQLELELGLELGNKNKHINSGHFIFNFEYFQ